MKKWYEKKNKSIICSVIFLMLEALFLWFLFNRKIVMYEKFSGVVVKDDLLVFLLSDEQLKMFYKNKIVFVQNKSKKFTIKKVDKNVLKRNGVSYNHVFIKLNISNKYKENDILDVSIMCKSVKSINIFRIILGGD